MEQVNFSTFDTEGISEKSKNLDMLSTEEAVLLMNDMDRSVSDAVRKAAPQIAEVVDHIVAAFENGGRLIYCGCGTSGRLGVIDASECPPTFSADPSMVVGIIAGGDRAIRYPVENAEDSPEAGAEDMKKANLSSKDVLVAISSSGYAPYCEGALEYGKSVGAFTALLCCVENSRLGKIADVTMAAVVGPEILSGSTRLRAGTATKMILNMLTTISMVRCGRVYQNLMVDVRPTNRKLRDRAVRIVMSATSCTRETAVEALEKSKGSEGLERPKIAILMILTGKEKNEAEETLKKHNGFVRKALEELQK